MLLIFSENITDRVHYTFDLILRELLGIKYSFTTDKSTFSAYESYKFNYSESPIEDELFFESAPLLYQRSVTQQNIEVFEYKGYKAFFGVGNSSALPFDIFAATFYLVSRYEEYLPSEKDQHDRYQAKSSLAYKYDFLKQPLVNIWVKELEQLLKEWFPDLSTTSPSYHFLPTYDIDIAYSFEGKGFFRNFFGTIRSFKNLKFKKILHRYMVIAGFKKDPYDIFKLLKQWSKKYKKRATYFFLVGDYGAYDKNITLDSILMQDLVKSVGDYSDVGLHPSYASNKSQEILKREHESLVDVLKKEVIRSRQHYIKLNLPNTYHHLLDLDITKDYSMGYAEEIGFRASIASSFLFYDLKLGTPTNLRIYPFAMMDVTLKNYMQLQPAEAIVSIEKMVDTVKEHNGLFITIWHNHTLSETDTWEGWQEVYMHLLDYACKTD